MAVTLTASSVIDEIFGNIIHLQMHFLGTGTVTGGAVSYSGVIPYTFNPDDRVYYRGGVMSHNAAITVPAYTRIINSHWSSQKCHDGTDAVSFLINCPATSGWKQTPDSGYVLSAPEIQWPFTHEPWYLGKPLILQPTIDVYFDTNTDAKAYMANLYFMINRARH